MNNYIFLHNAHFSDQSDNISFDIIDKTISSGLMDICSLFQVVGIGKNTEEKFLKRYENFPFQYTYCGDSLSQYEIPTLKLLIENAKSNLTGNSLYMMNKGASKTGKLFSLSQDWKDWMLFCCVENYKTCLKALSTGYDMAGCNYRSPIPNKKRSHYSGNWWWADNNFISKIDTNKFSEEGVKKIHPGKKLRHAAELVPAESDLGKYFCFAHSNIDHYKEPWKREQYFSVKHNLIENED